MPCFGDHRPIATAAMKESIKSQDAIQNPPRVILANLMKDKPLIPVRGLPTIDQINNVLKIIRRDGGAKNSIKAIRERVQVRFYMPNVSESTPFIFGAKLDAEGYAYVGSGEDDDPFILGITSVGLIDNCLKYASGERFAMFHADATFKLSDIGYPVITCGFTDKARSYQVGAIFVVSQRMRNKYARCFESFTRLIHDVRGRKLHVHAAMGDADDAQYLSLSDIPELASTKVLMCFFHVLYNVRKRTQILSIHARKMVMTSIMDMHFCTSKPDFERCQAEELLRWGEVNELKKFSEYFKKQWLGVRYSKWQVYHSPGGYATTNNPCEVFNAGIKLFTQRKRLHMKLLLNKLCELVTVTPIIPPHPAEYVPAPTSDLVAAACLMMETKRVIVVDTDDISRVRVLEIDAAKAPGVQRVSSTSPIDGDDSYFRSIFDDLAEETSITDTNTGVPSPVRGNDPILQARLAEEEDDSERASKASVLYSNSVKWSMRRAHRMGMPENGWLIDITHRVCGCKYFVKFEACAHILVARDRRGIDAIGADGDRKLKNRVIGKAKRLKGSRKIRGGGQSKTAPPATPQTSSTGIVGRPPRAAGALTIQFLLSE